MDVLLSCDFEDDDWWRAWGSKKPPENTSLVEGKDDGILRGWIDDPWITRQDC